MSTTLTQSIGWCRHGQAKWQSHNFNCACSVGEIFDAALTLLFQAKSSRTTMRLPILSIA